MKRFLGILLCSLVVLGCERSTGLKNAHIQHQLTAMLADLSAPGAGGNTVRKAMADLDALTTVESATLSRQQCDLLLEVRQELKIAHESWDAYKIHAGQNLDPVEDRKANESMQSLYAALAKAKQSLSDAAATF